MYIYTFIKYLSNKVFKSSNTNSETKQLRENTLTKFNTEDTCI